MTQQKEKSQNHRGKKKSTLKQLFYTSRPRFWFYLAGPALLGIVYGASDIDQVLSILPAALFLYFLLPANIMLYGINDIFDARIDRYNPKKVDKEVKYQGNQGITIAVIFSALVGVIFFLYLPLQANISLAIFYLLAVQYSAPPLRFKTKPILDSVSNGLYIVPGIITYTAITGSTPPISVVIGGWLWTMAMHTFSAIPDIEPDREAGIQTTATFLGRNKTYLYCGAIWLGSAIGFAPFSVRMALLMMVYPSLLTVIVIKDIDTEKAYWYYPLINTGVGFIVTLRGLDILIYG